MDESKSIPEEWICWIPSLLFIGIYLLQSVAAVFIIFPTMEGGADISYVISIYAVVIFAVVPLVVFPALKGSMKIWLKDDSSEPLILLKKYNRKAFFLSICLGAVEVLLLKGLIFVNYDGSIHLRGFEQSIHFYLIISGIILIIAAMGAIFRKFRKSSE